MVKEYTGKNVIFKIGEDQVVPTETPIFNSFPVEPRWRYWLWKLMFWKYQKIAPGIFIDKSIWGVYKKIN